MGLFRRGRAEASAEDVYAGLRAQALGLEPDMLGDALPADAPILALLMEMGYPEAVATLLAVADGSTSLYISTGGGIIGAGEHETVASASRRWLDVAVPFLERLEPCDDAPPPSRKGATQFVAVTSDGLRAASAPEDELGEGRHKLSPLFHAGHDVITEIRLLEEG
jgi:hypothetical protein